MPLVNPPTFLLTDKNHDVKIKLRFIETNYFQYHKKTKFVYLLLHSSR